MRNLNEAVLAVALTGILGLGFWLFAADSPNVDSDGGDPNDNVIEVDPAAAARGEILASDIGCLACHTVDGTPSTGPTWKGLAGTPRPLESGETVVADDTYLTLSIVDPTAQVVAGFDPVMPSTYSDQLTQDEIGDLVEYIQSLAAS